MRRIFAAATILFALSIAAARGHAAVVADHQFNTVGDAEGWVDRGIGTGSAGLTANGQSLTAVSPGLDPQLKYSGALERAADASWGTVTFRVRETETSGGEPIVFDPVGSVVQINKGVKPQGGITISKPADFTVEESGDGFYTVTVSIAGFEAQIIDELRIDPIGGTLKNSNSDTAGNTFEIDMIQVTDTSEGSAAEPE